MVNRFVILLILCLLSACANRPLSKNIIKTGKSTIKGGVSKVDKWSEEMQFHRVSWYRDFSLMFDTHMWQADQKSKFINWFSKKEKSYLDKCDKFYVVLSYTLNPDLLSVNDFIKQLEKQGVEYIELPQFKSHLKLHPHFEENSFQLYKIGGLCQQGEAPLQVHFPGYQEIAL